MCYLNEQVWRYWRHILICLQYWIIFLAIICDVWQHLSIVMYLNCLSETYKGFFLWYSGWQYDSLALSILAFILKLAALRMYILWVHWFSVSWTHYQRPVFAGSFLCNLYIIRTAWIMLTFGAETYYSIPINIYVGNLTQASCHTFQKLVLCMKLFMHKKHSRLEFIILREITILLTLLKIRCYTKV